MTDVPDAGRTVAGDPGVAARMASGRLEDVPLEAVAAGLGLPLHDYLGLELVGLRPVELQLPLREASRNLAAPLHGGAVATLVDVAAGVAVATSGLVDVTSFGLLTTRLEVDYHAQPRGQRVRATAAAHALGRRELESRIEVRDDVDRVVATARVVIRLLPGGVAGVGDGAA